MVFTEKVRKLIRQRAFLFKLILTIIGFICIPLIVVQIFLIGQSTEEFQKSNEKFYISLLDNCANSFATQENILSQIALQISLDETIQKPVRHNATPYSRYAAAEALKNYGNEVLSVEHTGVFYAEDGYVLIDGLKYELADYCGKLAQLDDAQAQKIEVFFQELQTMSYCAVLDDDLLIAAHPISLSAVGSNDAVVFFLLDAKTLEQSYQSALSVHSSFAVLDQTGLFLLRGEDFAAYADAESVRAFMDSAESVWDWNDDLLLYRYQDPESGYTFLLSMSRDESEQTLIAFATQVRNTMYYTLMLMCVSLMVTLYINYRPIHRLLEKHLPKDGKQVFSELERIDSAFFAMDERMSTQQNLLMDFILGDLLFGATENQELVSQYFPPNRYASFVVAAVRDRVFTTAQSKLLAAQIIEGTGCNTHITKDRYQPHAIIVCLSQSEIEPKGLKRGIEDILSSYGIDVCVTMGQVVDDIYALRKSYRSSLMMNPEVHARKAELSDLNFSQKIQRMIQCVYVGDQTEAMAHLAALEGFVIHELAGEGLRRYYCYHLLHGYLTSVNQESRLEAWEVEGLLAFSESQELFTLLRDSIRRVCGQVATTERSADQQLQQKLLDYVNEHYRSVELCLTTAADYLGTSIYVVSRLFKEATGVGFKDYVTEKRLEYSHMLLCSTQGSIAEIAAAAGFESSNYFSTVFKLKYGLPPTRYRKMMADQQLQ